MSRDQCRFVTLIIYHYSQMRPAWRVHNAPMRVVTVRSQDMLVPCTGTHSQVCAGRGSCAALTDARTRSTELRVIHCNTLSHTYLMILCQSLTCSGQIQVRLGFHV